MKRLLLLPIFIMGSVICMNTDSGSIGSQSDNTFQSSVSDLVSNWDNYFGSSNDTTSTTDTVTTSTDTSTNIDADNE